MSRARREGRTTDAAERKNADLRRSEAGDTLVEILIALAVIGIAATAILLAFATSISGSGDQRNEVNFDTMLRTASAEVTSAIQQQASTVFDSCTGASAYATPGSIALPNSSYAAYVSSVQYQSANPSASGDTYQFSPPQSPGTACPGSGSPNPYADSPQLLTVAVRYLGSGGGTDSIQTVVGDPYSPSSTATTCNAADPPTQLIFLEQPTDGPNGSAGAAGSALYPPAIVQIEDHNNNPCQNDIANVTLGITPGTGASGATLQDCSPSTQTGETIYTGCSISKPNAVGDGYTLTATDAVDHLTAVSLPFDVSAGVPAQLIFSTQPVGGTGGSAMAQIVVEVADSQGDLVSTDTNPVTLAIGTNPATPVPGTLTGCTAPTIGGYATFNGCTIDKKGNGYTLTASDPADDLAVVTSQPFNVTAGKATQLSFTTAPSGAAAGTKFSVQPVVTLLDAGGNVANSTDAVSLAIGTNPSSGVLSGCTETTTAGVATFSNCSISKAGSGYTLVAHDTTTPSVQSATSGAFNILYSPTVTATGPGTGTAGTAIAATNISSVLASGSTNPTVSGTITYTVFGPQTTAPTTCTTGGTTVSTATVNGNATYHPTTGFTPSAAGDYWWYASYGGDANNVTATSTCGATMSETVVAKASPTLTTVGPATNAAGATISTNLTSTLAGSSGTTASGTVTFKVFGPQTTAPTTCTTGGTTVGTATVSGNGAYHPATGYTPTTIGDYWWYASYGGDTNNNAATSTCGATMSETVVGKGVPTLTTTGPTTGTIGTAITTANISAALAAASGTNATGTITFTVFGPQATAPTTCTSGGTTVGTGTTVAGNATYHPSASYTPPGAGDFWWYASYGGDTNNNAATSTCGATMSETVVSKFSPTLTATGPATGTIGTAITTANISSVLAAGTTAPPVTGTITYTVFGPQTTAPTTCATGGTTVGTGTTVNGNATYHPSAGYTPAAGDYWWYASYGGDANNNAATSTCGATMSETVVAKASPTLTATGPATATIGTAITTTNISSTLAGGTTTPAPSGTITFTVFGPQTTAPTTCTTGGTTVGAATVTGNATYHPSAGYTPTGAGDYWWYASYGGDANNNTAASTCGATMSETVVAKFSPTVTVAGPSTASAGAAVATTNINSIVAGGTTTPSITGTITFKVFGPQTSAPTTCTTGGTTVGTGTTVAGNATYNPTAGFTPTTIGDYWWYASYGGDTNNNAANSACGATMSETVVGKAVPTLTATGPATGTAGTAIATGNISSALAASSGTNATGTISFKVFGPQTSAPTTCTTGGTAVGTGTTVAGNATYNPSAGYTPTTAGDYWWYASYGGDTNNNTAASTCGATMSETVVGKALPTLTTTGPSTGTAGTAITAANISSALAASSGTNATGTITFTVFGPQATAPTTCTTGGTTVGTATVAGNATYHPSAGYTPAGAGDYWWYASYGGDTNNNTATSTCGATMSETVVGKASPTVTATGPATGTIGTAIPTANISSTLAGGTTTPAPSGTITFTVFGPQTTAPTTCTTGGTAVGTGTTVTGNATYNPTTGFTPTGAGDYWWYASYGGDANNNTATSTCGATMSETVVAKFSPTITIGASASTTAGTAIAPTNINSVLAGGTTTPGVTGTISFKVFGPQTSAPTTCNTGGTAVGTGTTVNGNATYNPTAGFTPTTIGDYWWYASYGGDTNNNAATSACGATMSETIVGKASPTLTTTGPATGTAGTAIATSNISSSLAASSGTNATGTVTFTVFGPQTSAPTTCTTGGTAVGTGTTVTGNATYNPTAGYTPGAAGDYWWYASYGGDTNNNTATSTCGATMSETVVGKAVPSLTTTGPATGTAGTAITTTNISSALSGGTTAPAATGTVTFTVFGPQATAPTTCTTGGTTVGTATVAGNATYHPSAGYTPGAAGDYWWYASYGGDTNNNTATSTCGATMSETVVGKASPTVTATGPATGTIGTAIPTANISSALAGGTTAPAATGTITFTVFGPQTTAPTTCTTGGTAVGTGTTVNGNATYNPTTGFTPTGAGDYWWYASYGGDANNNTATSTCGATMSETVVAKFTPTVTIGASGSTTTGTAIAATSINSVLAGGTTTPAVTGTITFKVFGPQTTAPTTCTTGGTAVGTGTTVNGNATYNPTAGFTPTTIGDYWWYASYGGDTNNNAATSACGATMSETIVGKASPTLTTTGPATGTAGTAIATGNISSSLAASSGTNATGTISFKVFGPQTTAPTTCTTGGTAVGTGTAVTGNATYNPTAGFTPTTIGDYWWYASYGGDTNNNAATSACGATMSETVVGKALPTLTATGPATGTAATAITATNISSALAASSGTNATGTVTFTVFGPQTTAPTTCTTGGTTVGTATVAGNATYNPSAGYTPGAAGDYWWYASYGGDANNIAATSTCGATMSETVVAKASPTLTTTGPATGTIGTAIPTANISSAFAGGTTAPAATGTITFTVFGPQATAPTTCTTGGTTVGTGTVAGNATYHPSATYTPTGAGDYWWYASYGGDGNNSTATSTCGASMSETVVAKFSPTVTIGAPGTGTIGTAIPTGNINSVFASGTTAPAATGTITFTVFGPQSTAPTACTTGGTTVGTGTTVNGNATYHPSASYTPTGAGDYWWYASYGGDANNNTATSTCGATMSETVVAKFSPTVTAAGPASGTAGTAIATTSISSALAGGTTAPAATGTVSYTVFGPQTTAPTTCTTGGTAVGTGTTVNGNATYNPTAGYTPTTVGDYWWYASYGGDANNNTAASTCGATMSETVVSKASPTLTTTGPATGTTGTAITAANISSAFAASSGANATGTISFKVFGPQASAPTTCTTGGTAVGTGTTVSGNATYNPSAGYTPTTAGDYWWYASYGGDTNNNTATSTCGAMMSETVVTVPVTVTQEATGNSTSSTLTTGAFSMVNGTTYIITALDNDSSGTEPTVGFTITGGETPALISNSYNSFGGTNSPDCNNYCYEWAWSFTANETASATVKLTGFNTNTYTVADVLALGAGDVITTGATSNNAGKAGTATANLATAATAGDVSVEIIDSDDTMGTSLTWSAGSANLFYSSTSNGSLGVYDTNPAVTTDTTSATGFGSEKGWATIALEIAP